MSYLRDARDTLALLQDLEERGAARERLERAEILVHACAVVAAAEALQVIANVLVDARQSINAAPVRPAPDYTPQG